VNLAGRPGTHESWSDFPAYLRDNVECVDRLAQACIDAHVTRLVHASSSSVYGRLAIGSEDVELAPISPYGVSKLAGEATLRAHHTALGLPMVLLRFFSVYGPGQRPDMGVYRAIEAALTGRRFQLHGTGLQTRSMTYVDDLVAGIMLATESPMDGQTYNLGGSSAVSMIEVLQEVGRLVGRPAYVVGVEDPPGNQQHTSADLTNATMELGYTPKVGLTEGLARQVEWQRGQLAV
jgi:UDP-glucuronate 4-epimerase